MFAFGLFDKAPSGSPSAVATNSADQGDATQLAEEGTVLLKNSGSVLPLTSSDTSIAVIGADASTSPQTAGGGSAGVNSSGTVTPLQGIQAAAPSGTTVTYNNGSSDSSAASAAAAASVAIVFANLGESEGSDLTSIDLGTTQDNLITSVAAANPNTIVVLNTGSAVTMPWLSSVKGVLEAWYPGQEDGTAIASVLFGNYDPSGHLTVTFPTSLSQVPASTTAQWPGTGGTVQYSEGIDVGYRWYDSQDLTPLFPFGYGLSYTTFSFSNLQVGSLTAGGSATVTATVTNTGSRSGADVAQLYVDDPSASGQPPLQLEGFQRVSLAAGASTTVTFSLTQQNLQYWNSSSNAWATQHRQLRHLGRRLQREPAADRHPVGRLQSAGPAGHPGQPRPAGQPGQPGRLHRHPQRHGHHQRADPDLLGRRPARRPVDLLRRRDLRHPHHGRHEHGDGHREGRQRRLRHPELRMDRLPGHRQRHRVRHRRRSPATKACAWTTGRPAPRDYNPIQVYTCNGTDAQQWTVESTAPLRCSACASTSTGRGQPTAPWSTCTPATAPSPRSGQTQSNGELINPNPASAWTTPASEAQERRSRSGPAPTAPTSNGTCPDTHCLNR